MSAEKRIQDQLALAAQAGYAAQHRHVDAALWNSLTPTRRKELIEAACLVRSAVVLGERDVLGTCFTACNRNRTLGVSYTFIGAVTGYLREWGLKSGT
jgi:hypothetical protein